MPDYLFSNTANPKQIISVFFHMNEVPSIGSTYTDGAGTKWKRVATKPRASVDTKMDPYSVKDYVKATNKRGSIGDLWDRSKEASIKREEKEGTDPVKQKFYDDYAKRRKGKRHPQELREQGTKKLKAKGISVDWGDD